MAKGIEKINTKGNVYDIPYIGVKDKGSFNQGWHEGLSELKRKIINEKKHYEKMLKELENSQDKYKQGDPYTIKHLIISLNNFLSEIDAVDKLQ